MNTQVPENALNARSLDIIHSAIFDLETPVTAAESCSAAIHKLIDYVEIDKDLQQVLYRVQTDLDQALLASRKTFELHHGD